MHLRISNRLSVDLTDFVVSYLIPSIQDRFVRSLNEAKIAAVEKSLKHSLKKYVSAVDQKRPISVKNILIGAINNLHCIRTGTDYIVEIDPNIPVPGMYLRYAEAAAMVNYGTLSTAAYPVFDETFNYFAVTIEDYLRSYSEM